MCRLYNVQRISPESGRKNKISDIALSQVNTARLIRGYAANNSRALFRRRSSTTDYVSLGREQDSKESQEKFSQVTTDKMSSNPE